MSDPRPDRPLPFAVALVVEGGPLMRSAVLRAAGQLSPGIGRFEVITLREDSELTARLAQSGIPHRSLDTVTATDYPSAIARLARLIHARKFDVVHGVEPIAGTVASLAALTARRAGRLFDRQHSAPAGRTGRALSQVAARTSDLVRVPSNAAAAWTVAEDRVPPTKVRVVHNAAAEPREIAPAERVRLRASLGIEPGEHVVCSVARLRPEKQLDAGIRARALLSERSGAPLHYVIVGEGPARGALERAAANSPYVHFVGHQDDVWGWYAAADVAWIPSANESFGIAAAEALAAGVPVVCSRVGGLVEVVSDGQSGLLIEPGDPIELASATLGLLADSARRREMAAAARMRYLEAFSPAAIIPAMHELYLALASLRTGLPLASRPSSPR